MLPKTSWLKHSESIDMYPKTILTAAHAVERSRRAADAMQSTTIIDGLQNAENLLWECHRFATSVAESKTIDPDDVSQLLSFILGFEARCLGGKASNNDLEGYNRRLVD